MKYVIFVQQDLIQFISALILHLILMWKIKAKVKKSKLKTYFFFYIYIKMLSKHI